MVDLSELQSQKKLFPAPSIQQLSIVPELGVKICTLSLIHDEILSLLDLHNSLMHVVADSVSARGHFPCCILKILFLCSEPIVSASSSEMTDQSSKYGSGI